MRIRSFNPRPTFSYEVVQHVLIVFHLVGLDRRSRFPDFVWSSETEIHLPTLDGVPICCSCGYPLNCPFINEFLQSREKEASVCARTRAKTLSGTSEVNQCSSVHVTHDFDGYIGVGLSLVWRML